MNKPRKMAAVTWVLMLGADQKSVFCRGEIWRTIDLNFFVFGSKIGILKLSDAEFETSKSRNLPKSEKYFQKPLDKSDFWMYNRLVIAENDMFDEF